MLQQAVNDGALPANGVRQLGKPVKARQSVTRGSGRRKAERDTTRALTRDERDAVIAYADGLVSQPAIERVRRKRQSVADLTAFLAGTGVRVADRSTNPSSPRSRTGSSIRRSHPLVAAPPAGLEPATKRLEGSCSIH